jgi:hypothetical protein
MADGAKVLVAAPLARTLVRSGGGRPSRPRPGAEPVGSGVGDGLLPFQGVRSDPQIGEQGELCAGSHTIECNATLHRDATG